MEELEEHPPKHRKLSRFRLTLVPILWIALLVANTIGQPWRAYSPLGWNKITVIVSANSRYLNFRANCSRIVTSSVGG